MVRIITVEDKSVFQKEILAMFEERKLVFVDLLKWNLPVTDDRYEIDQFDGDAAVYLLVSHEDGSHLGSMRLTPYPRQLLRISLCPRRSGRAGYAQGDAALPVASPACQRAPLGPQSADFGASRLRAVARHHQPDRRCPHELAVADRDDGLALRRARRSRACRWHDDRSVSHSCR
jgi:hypothetical protein